MEREIAPVKTLPFLIASKTEPTVPIMSMDLYNEMFCDLMRIMALLFFENLINWA